MSNTATKVNSTTAEPSSLLQRIALIVYIPETLAMACSKIDPRAGPASAQIITTRPVRYQLG